MHKNSTIFNYKYNSQINYFITILATKQLIAVESLEEYADNYFGNKIVVLFGDQDWMNQEGAQRLAKLGKIQMCIIDKSMHSPQLDNARMTMDIIDQSLLDT